MVGRPVAMASLILGPVVRYVGTTEATVWVETDRPCEVEVLGHRAGTFHVDRLPRSVIERDGSAG
jgi:hypothetical protein